MKNLRGGKIGAWALYSLLAVIGVTFTMMYLLTPYFGDDWGYLMVHRTATGLDGHYPVWQFWVYGLRHWLPASGRMANFLASLSMGLLPKWIIDVILGLAALAGAALIVRLGGLRDRKYSSMAVVLVAVYALLFPWWDMMFTIDFAFNYPFTLAIVLGAIYLFIRLAKVKRNSLKTGLITVVGLIAGCMHESATLALLLGLMVWLWQGKKWKELSYLQRWLIIAFAAGTIISTLSPGILFRASGGEAWRVPDDPGWLLVVKSAPVTLIIFAAYVISLIFSKREKRDFEELFRSPAVVWAIASIIALGPVAVGGIVGRSGWFSQAYAMIFLGCWWRRTDVKMPAALAAIAWILTVAQSVATAVTAVEFSNKIRAIDSAYLASSDGIVFADDVNYLTSPWWTLQRIDHRTQDLYGDRKAIADFNHKSALPVILPPEAKTLDFTTLDEAEFHSGAIVTSVIPKAELNGSVIAIPFERSGRNFLLLLPKRELAWGERGFQTVPEIE